MKKSFIVLCLTFFTLSVMAADRPKQGFGFQIGWTQPVLRINSASNPSYAKDSLCVKVALKGFKAGVIYDASYIKGFGSSMGINYTFAVSNGGWRSAGTIAEYPRQRQMISYHELEVFVDWQYKFELAKETYLMLYTGPTIQCGLGLDMRSDHQNDYGADVTITRYRGYTTDNQNERFKRVNVTWGVGAGFQFQRYFLRGGYDFGLINPYANTRFVDKADQPLDHYTRGRLDQWSIKIGMYLWYND